ncbi:hypothetical protein SDC9_59207 [bioreactor metagenome]|uniref:Uncharacterized protein n=1 Tax=bioreactor metagenome TaxID=1076179 RepID=A0A644XFA8_9ZZZZ
MPEDMPRDTEIHRIDGMDAFEVCERLEVYGEDFDLNLVPLGPKPHALGMAMAYMKLGGRAEIIYAQPRAYVSNYSVGISRQENGHPDIVGYCLKWRGRQTF